MSNFAIGKSKYDIPLYLFLVIAGLAGNYFKFPLFLNIDFLFGSIFAMLALQIFGLGWAVAAAALIAGYTVILWNHPYAIIIMTAEVAVVGWLIGRHKLGLVLADTLYWLIVGIPLVFLFYHLVMQASLSNTSITMVKQAVNGIANALVARLIFIGFSFRLHASRTSYKEVIYSLLAFFVLFPALIMLVVGSRTDFNNTDLNVRNSLLQEKQRIGQTLEEWMLNRKSAIVNLADMAASRSPQQLQPYLELAKKSDTNFLRVGLVDKEGTSTAFSPQFDELGQSNIGLHFADRPYIPVLKQTLKPMLSEVVMGRIGSPKPIVIMLAPVVIHGAYGGYVPGVLSLDQLQANLKNSTSYSSLLYTLLDKNGSVIMTNRPDQTVMKPFVRGEGKLNFLDAEIAQWVPRLSPNTPISDRWKKSFYVAEFPVGDLGEWKLVLEQPVAPFQKALFDNYTSKLTLMFFVLLGALTLAEFVSRRTIATLEILSKITSGLSARLAADQRDIAWPESNIEESTRLIDNFKVMSDSLAEQFSNIKRINESLEQRVEERTSALKESEERLRLEVARMPIGYILWDRDFRVVSWNPAAEKIFGFTFDEAKGRHPYELIVPPEVQPQVDDIWRRLLDGDESAYSVNENQTKDGRTILCSWTNTPLKKPDGTILGVMAMVQDVTKSKKAEAEIKTLNRELERRVTERTADLEAANKELEAFSYSVSHDLRAPLRAIDGFTHMLQEDYANKLDDEGKRLLNVVRNNAERMGQLIDDILQFSRTGRLAIAPSKIDMEEMAREVAAELQPAIEGSKLHLDIGHIPPAKGDRAMMRQVFVNLLSNAIKFSRGKETPRIQVGATAKDDETVYFVKDNGAGFDMQFADKLFGVFQRLHSTTEFEGTGIGLAIVKRIITRHGGRVWAEGKINEGATIYFALPKDGSPHG